MKGLLFVSVMSMLHSQVTVCTTVNGLLSFVFSPFVCYRLLTLGFNSKVYKSLFFQVIMFCAKEPDPFCGGETVLLNNRDLTALLDPKLTQKLEEKKIRYQSFLPNKDEQSDLQKSWQDRFWVDDPQVCILII